VSTKLRLREIDVLRGLAALWVVFSHYQPHWNDRLAPTAVWVPNSQGVHAVELFFVISGFVIFMTLDSCRNVADFAVMRFSRLYPAYWAALILSTLLGVLVFGDVLWPGGLLANATMLQEFIGVPHYDNVFWSLSVEMAFYVNAAWLFAFGLHRHVKPIVAVWLVLAALWAVTLKPPHAEHRHWLALLFALDYAPYFAMGMVFFDAMKRGWSRVHVALIVLATCTELLIDGWIAQCIAIFIALAFWLAGSGRLRFLVFAPTLWLGAISYSLYLIHRNLGYHMLDWLHARGLSAGAAIPLTILGALALATALTYGIERPSLGWIRAWYSAHRPPVTRAREI
jgi:peptidoglycan/LPS O-acetylase OafA/YrhL